MDSLRLFLSCCSRRSWRRKRLLLTHTHRSNSLSQSIDSSYRRTFGWKRSRSLTRNVFSLLSKRIIILLIRLKLKRKSGKHTFIESRNSASHVILGSQAVVTVTVQVNSDSSRMRSLSNCWSLIKRREVALRERRGGRDVRIDRKQTSIPIDIGLKRVWIPSLSYSLVRKQSKRSHDRKRGTKLISCLEWKKRRSRSIASGIIIASRRSLRSILMLVPALILMTCIPWIGIKVSIRRLIMSSYRWRRSSNDRNSSHIRDLNSCWSRFLFLPWSHRWSRWRSCTRSRRIITSGQSNSRLICHTFCCSRKIVMKGSIRIVFFSLWVLSSISSGSRVSFYPILFVASIHSSLFCDCHVTHLIGHVDHEVKRINCAWQRRADQDKGSVH